MIPIHLKHYLFLLIAAVLALNVSAQSFSIGNTTSTFFDSSRNRDVETRIYYPADSPGENVPVATGSFPVLVLGHGFLIPVSVSKLLGSAGARRLRTLPSNHRIGTSSKP